MVVECSSDWTGREKNKEAVVLQKFLLNHVDEILLIRMGCLTTVSVTTHGHIGTKFINRSCG